MEKTTTGALAPSRKAVPINREQAAKDLSVKINGRNLARAVLTDTYGTEFHLSDSSSAKQDAVWFTIVGQDSLHLNKENAIALIVLLNNFVEKGTIR
jgi:hypothetical protein